MYTLSRKKRLVSVRFGRQLSFHDVQTYARNLTADPAFEPGFSEIADLTEVEELTLSPAETMKLADLADPFRPGAKRAFVARTDLQVRAARMHQLLRTDDVNIRIFASSEEAEEWIGTDSRRPALVPVLTRSKMKA